MKITIPTPQQIKAIRHKAGLTQKQAAGLLHVNLRSWQKYEGGEREIHPAFWELFLIKINQEEIADNKLSE